MGAKPSLDDLRQLVDELILPFYLVERDMGVPGRPDHPENDAEHSWSLALMAPALASRIDPKLDGGKLAIYAVVHDLVELFAGDTSVWGSESELATKHERETAAQNEIRNRFKAFPWIAEMIDEYERKENDEAKFIWALDKLMSLQIRFHTQDDYIKMGVTRKQFDERLVEHRRKAHAHPEIAKYYDEMRKLFEERPNLFAPEK